MSFFYNLVTFTTLFRLRRVFITMADNASFSLSNTSSTPTVHVILNIISLVATATGTLLSFAILAGVLLRKKTFHDVQLLLCTNNYILVFALGVVELMDMVNTLQGDFGFLINVNLLGCKIQGYIIFSLTSAVYLSCVLQVSHRYRAFRIDQETSIR